MSSSIEQQFPDALRNKVFHLRIELFWHRVVVAVSAEVVPMLALEVVLRNFNFHAGDEDAVGCLFGVHVAAALRIVAELISRRIGLPVPSGQPAFLAAFLRSSRMASTSFFFLCGR